MFTIKAIHKKKINANNYLTGFYKDFNSANNVIASIKNAEISFEIIDLIDIKSFAFYIIGLNNEFYFFQNTTQITDFVNNKNLKPDEDKVYFILYTINKNYQSIDGSDNMGSWDHEHVSDLDNIKMKKLIELHN